MQSRPNPYNWKQHMRLQENSLGGLFHIFIFLLFKKKKFFPPPVSWKRFTVPTHPWLLSNESLHLITPFNATLMFAAAIQPWLFSFRTLTLLFSSFRVAGHKKRFFISRPGISSPHCTCTFCVGFLFLPKELNRKGQPGLCMNIFPTFCSCSC